ncbi:MAG: DinB family protein [Candidatus Bathyarchaeota archaeon]|nr:MAG: DinB family protein [Candidatus Bathyarchaeota archaeon]
MDSRKIAKYMLWADDQARRLLEGLSEEEFSRDVLPPFGSIRSLCEHIILATEFNLKRQVDKEELDPKQFMEEISTVPKDRLLEMWRKADTRLIDFAKSRTDETYVFRNFLHEGKITLDQEDYLSQYLLHTQHHRAQIMSALRVMRKEAVTTDYLFYLSDIQ